MRKDPDIVSTEMVPTTTGEIAGQILKEGGALIRLENQTQMMVAIQRPRNEAVILREALQGLTIYPAAAEKAIYRKPVGKDPDTGKMKFAEGLSVRAAEDIANRWTNSAFAAEITGDDGEVVSGAAIFMDYEKNQRRVFPFRVSRKYKTKGGGTGTHPEDRFNDVVIPAKISRVLREAILRSLPSGLKAAYEEQARAVMAKAGGDTVGKMIAAFAKIGVSAKDLEKLMKKSTEAFKPEDVQELREIYNGIKEGETTVDQVFGGGDAPRESAVERMMQEQGAVFDSKPETFPATEPAPAAPDPAPKIKRGRQPVSKDAETRNLIWARLRSLAGGDVDLAAQMLARQTLDHTPEGEEIPGFDHIKDVPEGAPLETLAKKVADLFQKSQGNGK